MGDPRDQDDEEAERKREVVRPERHEAGPQTAFDARMLEADLEDEPVSAGVSACGSGAGPKRNSERGP